MKNKKLRGGYTTGVHTSFAFKSALSNFIAYNQLSISKTNKMDNDDLDVTKGCEIIVSISNNLEDLQVNKIEHKPYEIISDNKTIYIYAGYGAGVVTKKGLKAKINHPAINPVPLNAINDIFNSLCHKLSHKEIYCTVEVTNGEEIAKQTANAKVGVLGGISILGTSGMVKPISASAYIDSVKTEILFAKDNGYDTLYFTLGNSAYNELKEHYDIETIIEVGNFVYDSFKIAIDNDIKNIIFICGIGKMTKIAQGFKNTHNRFGSIDFISLQKDIQDSLNYCVDIESTKTVKGISQELEKINKLDALYDLLSNNANKQIQKWFKNSNIKAIILENKKELPW